MKKFLTVLAAVFLLAACKSNTLISNPNSLNDSGSAEEDNAPVVNQMPVLNPDGSLPDVEEKVVNEDGEQSDGGSEAGGEATGPNVFAPADTGSDPESSGESAVKTFEVTAKNWEFVPSTITVNQGDKVKLTLKSVDVTHGFALPAYDVSVNLFPGSSETVEFTADKTGTFSFYCNVRCGDGHSNMQGQLIVE